MMQPQPDPLDLSQWEHAPTKDLIAHIMGYFHLQARLGTARLEQAVAVAAVTDGARLPILVELQELMAAMCRRVAEHLREEERTLFPWILAGCPPVSPVVPDIFRTLKGEHHFVSGLVDMAEGVINRLKDEEAEGVHEIWRTLMDELTAVSKSLDAHVEIENRILYNRVLTKLEGRG
jgi:iron-sulfur cluster repair protein YtfE (RIC family)